MTPKNKGLLAMGVTFLITVLIHLLKDFESGDVKANWVIWAGLSWNYFAYAFDRGMLPSAFSELDGGGKGDPANRTFFFWGCHVQVSAKLCALNFNPCFFKDQPLGAGL
jgi:hypothetical protein